MSKNRKLIINTIVIAVLVFSILRVSYAFFTANLEGVENSTTLTIAGGDITIAFSGGPNISVANIIPSNNAIDTKLFTVSGKNTTGLIAPYILKVIIDENSFSDNAITYTLTSSNTNDSGDVVPSITDQAGIVGTTTLVLGQGNFETGDEKIHTYQLNMFFPSTAENQNSDQGKTFKAHINIESGQALEPNAPE